MGMKRRDARSLAPPTPQPPPPLSSSAPPLLHPSSLSLSLSLSLPLSVDGTRRNLSVSLQCSIVDSYSRSSGITQLAIQMIVGPMPGMSPTV